MEDETPEDFKFFIKIPKSISHEKRLKDCKEDISNSVVISRIS
jgi:uncharacterized protein YecE (DUF72 family)